jgi:hypothetical protein
MGWDKELTARLIAMGIDREKAGQIVGIVAEERQNADRQGYIRGYNNGWEDCKIKHNQTIDTIR